MVVVVVVVVMVEVSVMVVCAVHNKPGVHLQALWWWALGSHQAGSLASTRHFRRLVPDSHESHESHLH